MRTARQILVTAILLYLLLPCLVGIVSVIPGADAVVWKIFLEMVGQVSLFETAAQLIGTLVDVEIGTEMVFGTVVMLVTTSALETAIIGLCITIATEATTRIHWQKGGYGHSPGFVAERTVSFTAWPLLIGVVSGVLITQSISYFLASSPAMRATVYGGVCGIGLMVWGIVLMVRPASNRKSFAAYQNGRVVVFLVKLLLGMIAAALCAAAIAALVLAAAYGFTTQEFWHLIAVYAVCSIAALVLSWL